MSAPARSTFREDVITLVLALWTTIGLLVDAYFHSTDPGLESFWTPWHALFYSGFTATAFWLGWMAVKRNDGPGTFLDWAPVGYRPALIGVALFSVGGVGDAIWHTIFGIEVDIDALLSPTHLLLFVGLVLIMSAPFRAAWDRTDRSSAPGLREFGVPLASLTLSTILVAFFFSYMWVLVDADETRIPFDPETFVGYTATVVVVGGALLSTLIMFTPLVVAARRWRLPFGSATILLTGVNVAIAYGFDEDPLALPAVVATGLAFDLAVAAGLDRRLVALLSPAVLWIGYFLIVDRTGDGLGLAPEIWGGIIVFAALAVYSIEVIMDLAVRAARLADLPDQIDRTDQVADRTDRTDQAGIDLRTDSRTPA